MATKTKTTGKVGNKVQGETDGKKLISDNPVDKRAVSLPTKAPGQSKSKIASLVEADSAYLTLIRRLPLRPLRTDAELDAASDLIDELIDRDDLSLAESDYLDVLGDLVEKYEDQHIELPHLSDAKMLQSLMEERGVRQADVVRGTGISKTVLSLVLNGKRELTREHIGMLSKYFEVNPSVFLGPT